ncbi:MAG: plastocyanin/azurin family copper-binding protein [Gemmatimonadaceae bacterium]
MRLPRLAILFSALTLAACGDATGNDGPDPTDLEVRVGNNFFSPATRSIDVGETVTWTWNMGSVTHNVTFTGGPASPNQSSGTFQRTFSSAGTFNYQCTIHGASMSGSVIVN